MAGFNLRFAMRFPRLRNCHCEKTQSYLLSPEAATVSSPQRKDSPFPQTVQEFLVDIPETSIAEDTDNIISLN